MSLNESNTPLKELQPYSPVHRLTAADLCAVVVTYHPDSGAKYRLKRIISQSGYLIIVDNASPLSEIDFGDLGPRVELIRNERNEGVAAALNRGIQRAMELGYHWVITFDQDTEISTEFVQLSLSALAQVHRPEGVGVLGANFVDSNTGRIALRSSDYLVAVNSVITSGTLMSLRAYAKVGGFCDSLFIDLVDHEYCLRLRRNGYSVLMTSSVSMRHSLGNRTEFRVGPARLTLMNSSPLRRYYLARNSLWLAHKYVLCFPLAIAKILAGVFLVDAVLKMPFEGERRQKWLAIFMGIRDAFLGKHGEAGLRVCKALLPQK